MNSRKKEIISLILAATTLVSAYEYSKKIKCDINTDHAHKYTNDEGYLTYMDKEYNSYKGYDRTDEYIEISGDEKELLKFLNKRNILKISDNLEIIEKTQNEYKKYDHIEYEYAYTYHTYIHTGKVTVPVAHTGHSWTLDKNHYRLTGKTRNCNYLFYGVKVEKNEKGKYVITKSPYTSDVTTIMDKYPYIKKDYVVVYDKENNCTYNDVTKSIEELKKLKTEYSNSFENNKILNYK